MSKSKHALVLTALFVLISAGTQALAQYSIQGKVFDERTSETLPFVNILIPSLNIGTQTDAEGNFAIDNLGNGEYSLTVSYVGYITLNQVVSINGSNVNVDFNLAEDIIGLDEVVVTGVGRGTQTKKLGFSVAKLGEKNLQEVPPANVADAIRAKIPGVTVLQASGDPSTAATIRLRGSTSLGNNQEPLVIVDGVITQGGLRDINMQDVESIEIVKGAAGASIYGSLAGNGVIQILTKRGGDKLEKPRVTVKSELGFSEIANKYPLTNKHPWNLTGIEQSSDGKFITAWSGYEEYDVDANGVPLGWVNEYPILYDNVENVFTGQPYSSNYISISSTSQNYAYNASADLYEAGGVLEPVDPFKRNSVRFNADYTPDSKLDFGVSASYVLTEGPSISEQGQGDNYFYSVLTSEPFMNLTEKDSDGFFSNNPTGYSVQGSNWQNPLYVAEQREIKTVRDRVLVGINASYQILDNLSINARQSVDKAFQENSTFYPKGYKTPTPSPSLNNGFLGYSERESSVSVTEIWGSFDESFGDFSLNLLAKYLYEDRKYEQVDASGYDFSALGIVTLNNVDSETYSISSYSQQEKAENYFVTADLDFKDKIIASAMIRRDGSSSFGEDERYQTYYRGSLAYRVTEDFSIDNVDEWKIRASYGTSGQRPPFASQYETYSVTTSGISPNILGNSEIKPSVVAELEIGTDIAFLNRFNFVANYSLVNVENDYLLVPLAPIAGFSAQYQNVGEIENETFELGLSGNVYQSRDLTVSFNLSWDKTNQQIIDLGGVPPFTRSTGSAISLFRVQEGESYGAMYGNVIATRFDQLITDDQGFVINYGSGLTVDDFEINPHGYVIPKGTHGTVEEVVVYAFDPNTNEKLVGKIGDTSPDFKMGFSSNVTYKNFGFYFLADWVSGGDVYNYTKQLLYFNYRHKDLETFTNQGFKPQYMFGSSLYNLSNPNQHFVEDASYLKLREVSISYTLDESSLGFMSDYISDVKLSLIGRNLFTITNYTGWDPEVALRANATNFRLDEYSYPNFRTFSGSIQIRF